MSTPVRLEVVNQLVMNALNGLCCDAESVSANEMFSACMTLMFRVMKAAKTMGSDLEAFRPGIVLMYAELPPTPKAN